MRFKIDSFYFEKSILDDFFRSKVCTVFTLNVDKRAKNVFPLLAVIVFGGGHPDLVPPDSDSGVLGLI
jgi:hypothetical protein